MFLTINDLIINQFMIEFTQREIFSEKFIGGIYEI